METNDRFEFIMIKTSHYGDDGYPIVWWKTMIPSNSLAALHGIARDCVERQVLGPDVRLDLLPLDETNTHIVSSRVARQIRRRGVKALIGFVGVEMPCGKGRGEETDVTAPVPATPAHGGSGSR